MKIRQFGREDLIRIRELDFEAWAGLWSSGSSRRRTMSNLVVNWNDDPQGCFVAEDRGEFLGYIFSHICGSLGYIGVFGVHPRHRGEGIGKRLLRRSIRHLKSSGCSTIGLETRPDNQLNVGLYVRHGFEPKYVTFVLEHSASDHVAKEKVVVWDELDESQQRLVSKKLVVTCNAVMPGLNYVPMALARAQTSECRICTFNSTNPTGFALVRTAPRFEKEDTTDAFVEAMAVKRVSEAKFVGMIRTLETLTGKWGMKTVSIPVTSFNWHILETLVRKEGFRVKRVMLRMLYLEKMVSRNCVNLNFWAM
ncbi:MAG TPA: GNAT family N-acetyltransferase [Candidatus Acidoferrales bacterium]|nr:GNAT family N-acetyltransferase [Candidatus Acidoferrales bacterium]